MPDWKELNWFKGLNVGSFSPSNGTEDCKVWSRKGGTVRSREPVEVTLIYKMRDTVTGLLSSKNSFSFYNRSWVVTLSTYKQVLGRVTICWSFKGCTSCRSLERPQVRFSLWMNSLFNFPRIFCHTTSLTWNRRQDLAQNCTTEIFYQAFISHMFLELSYNFLYSEVSAG